LVFLGHLPPSPVGGIASKKASKALLRFRLKPTISLWYMIEPPGLPPIQPVDVGWVVKDEKLPVHRTPVAYYGNFQYIQYTLAKSVMIAESALQGPIDEMPQQRVCARLRGFIF